MNTKTDVNNALEDTEEETLKILTLPTNVKISIELKDVQGEQQGTKFTVATRTMIKLTISMVLVPWKWRVFLLLKWCFWFLLVVGFFPAHLPFKVCHDTVVEIQYWDLI